MNIGDLRIVDLSVPLAHLAPSEPLPAKIHYVRHAEEGLAQMQQFFGVTPADLVYSNGQGWAIEQIEAITHTGTHVDALITMAPFRRGSRLVRSTRFPSNGASRRACSSTSGTKRPARRSRSTTFRRRSTESITRLSRSTSSSCKPAPTCAGFPRLFPPTRIGPRRRLVACGTGGPRHRHRRVHTRPAVRRHGRRLPPHGRRPAYLAGPLRRFDARILPDRETRPLGPDRPAARFFRLLLAGQH